MLTSLSFYSNNNAFSSFPWPTLPKTLSNLYMRGNSFSATPFPSAAIAQLTKLNGGGISGVNFTGPIDAAACPTLCSTANLWSQLSMGTATGSCPPPTCLIECSSNQPYTLANMYQNCPISWNGNRSSVCKTPANGGIDDPVQCGALVDFAVATGWANWSASGVPPGWLSGASYCAWPGVTCASAIVSNGKLVVYNSSIVGLNLDTGTGFPNNVLVGTLPSTLARLTSLSTFGIGSQAGLTGQLPAPILALKSLTYFKIYATGMTYPLNSFLQSVTAMTRLAYLQVDGTPSGSNWCGTGTCSLPALPSTLTWLQLSNLGLSGAVRSLPPSLSYLSLYGNPSIKSLSSAAAASAANVNQYSCGGAGGRGVCCYLNNITFSCLPNVLLTSGRCSLDTQPPACEASPPPMPPSPPGQANVTTIGTLSNYQNSNTPLSASAKQLWCQVVAITYAVDGSAIRANFTYTMLPSYQSFAMSYWISGPANDPCGAPRYGCQFGIGSYVRVAVIPYIPGLVGGNSGSSGGTEPPTAPPGYFQCSSFTAPLLPPLPPSPPQPPSPPLGMSG